MDYTHEALSPTATAFLRACAEHMSDGEPLVISHRAAMVLAAAIDPRRLDFLASLLPDGQAIQVEVERLVDLWPRG